MFHFSLRLLKAKKEKRKRVRAWTVKYTRDCHFHKTETKCSFTGLSARLPTGQKKWAIEGQEGRTRKKPGCMRVWQCTFNVNPFTWEKRKCFLLLPQWRSSSLPLLLYRSSSIKYYFPWTFCRNYLLLTRENARQDQEPLPPGQALSFPFSFLLFSILTHSFSNLLAWVSQFQKSISSVSSSRKHTPYLQRHRQTDTHYLLDRTEWLTEERKRDIFWFGRLTYVCTVME